MANTQVASAAGAVTIEIPGDENCFVHSADTGKADIQVPCSDTKTFEAAFKKAASNPPDASVAIQAADDVHYLALFNAIGAALSIPGVREYRIGTASRQVLLKSPPAGGDQAAPVLHLGVTKDGVLVTWVESGQVTDPKVPRPLPDLAALRPAVSALKKKHGVSRVSLDVDRDAPVNVLIDAAAVLQDSGLLYFSFLGL